MKTSIYFFVGLTLFAMCTGCATGHGPVYVGNPDDVRPLTTKIEPQDVRVTVEKMAESLVADPGVLEATKGEKPVLDIEPMKNKTQMILDMKSITDSIRMRLIRSRQFRFVDRSTSGADITIMDEQAQLGLTDRRKAIRPGHQSAAQMYLTGELTEMTQTDGRTLHRSYKFSMILKDLLSGEIVWADENPISKVTRRPVF